MGLLRRQWRILHFSGNVLGPRPLFKLMTCPSQAERKVRNPEHAATSGRSAPNLRRFAAVSRTPQDQEQHPTTICGDVMVAAHREIGRLQEIEPKLRPEASVRVEAMLGVISYCYAKGLFDSGEIERRLWEDEAFLKTFEENIPSAQGIRAFRRRHRKNILAIIEEALQQYWQRASNLPPDMPGIIELSEAVRRKAQQLLDMACAIDQLDCD
jgi:hypothetical protein